MTTLDEKTSEFIKYHIKTGTNKRKKIIKYFEMFVNILKQNDIEFSADCGTLLGIIRDGHEILWDDDYDLFIFDDKKLDNINLPKMVDPNILPAYNKHKKTIISVYTNDKINIAIYKYYSFYQVFAYDASHIVICKITDIFPSIRYKHNKVIGKIVTKEKMTPFLSMKLNNMDIPIMKNYDEYLKCRYGEKYMDEYKVCNHEIDIHYIAENRYITISKDDYKYFCSLNL